MKKLSLFIIFPILLICSCASPGNHNANKTEAKSGDTAVSDKNTFAVTEPQIVFSWPDSISMLKMKANDSDSFYIAADDNGFYNSLTMALADSLEIKTSSTSITKLDFITSAKKHFIINRSSKDELQWGIFLFNGIDSPTVANGMELDDKYLKNFFKK